MPAAVAGALAAAAAAGLGALVDPLDPPAGDAFPAPNIPMLILNLDGSPFNMDGVVAAAAAFPAPLAQDASPSAPSGPPAWAVASAASSSVSTRNNSCVLGSGSASVVPAGGSDAAAADDDDDDDDAVPLAAFGAPAEAAVSIGLGTTALDFPKIPMPFFILSISSMDGVLGNVVVVVPATCFSAAFG